MELSGRVAVVTGGGRGIGQAVSLRLGALGAKVIVNYVNRAEPALETVAMIKATGGDAKALKFDVADGIATQEALQSVVADEGRLDILVNNAGITRDGLLVKMKDEAWDAVLDTNLKGAFNCIRAVSRVMMKQRGGRIINISSVIGFAGNPGQVNYASAKAGLIGLTKSVARELASRAITVNAVAPGYIETEMTSGLSEEVTARLMSEIPLARLGNPADVAAAVAYLASDDASYVTGQTIHVNGGMYM
ncbi:MAG: 3-oxoacyl-[acyl-carrier-protein] reductase [Proteobacteria bacterium]|nr:3-oxoacyl-[acyl-carrier-protein] reductase [Desulfobulbaceae bacterium]MBU4153192.1 3-oxoacyl-[acyl-carrier-protein] reductase [Pseudomonadota bacterium]MDP2106663.1 3-oxoacyl-[acyl-carrier-protein] reductase [Desulfobulbaceae bacterium]